MAPATNINRRVNKRVRKGPKRGYFKRTNFSDMGFLLVVEIGGSPQLLDSRKKPATLSKAPREEVIRIFKAFLRKEP
jgi:hypothetical protein